MSQSLFLTIFLANWFIGLREQHQQENVNNDIFLHVLFGFKDLAILECRFGFSWPNHICNQLERSGGQECGEHIVELMVSIFKTSFVFFPNFRFRVKDLSIFDLKHGFCASNYPFR